MNIAIIHSILCDNNWSDRQFNELSINAKKIIITICQYVIHNNIKLEKTKLDICHKIINTQSIFLPTEILEFNQNTKYLSRPDKDLYKIITKNNQQTTTTKRQYDENKRLVLIESYKDDILDGPYVKYKDDRRIKGAYKNGQKHGIWKTYCGSNPEPDIETYENGKLNGISILYDRDNDCKIIEKNVRTYKDDRLNGYSSVSNTKSVILDGHFVDHTRDGIWKKYLFDNTILSIIVNNGIPDMKSVKCQRNGKNTKCNQKELENFIDILETYEY